LTVTQSLGDGASHGVELGDLDGDGDLDIFIANYDRPGKIWLNDGSGTFSDNGQVLASTPSRDVALGDLDGDGDLDAFLTNLAQSEMVLVNLNTHRVYLPVVRR
jgi:FG-GAP-like repeat